jgi:hypothetical protein
MVASSVVAHRGMRPAGDGRPDMPRHRHNQKFGLDLGYTACTRVQSRATGRPHGLVRRRLLTVKIRQPSHEFTFGVGISFIPYPLVLTPVV